MLGLRNLISKSIFSHFYNAQKYKEEMILGNEIWVNILGVSV